MWASKGTLFHTFMLSPKAHHMWQARNGYCYQVDGFEIEILVFYGVLFYQNLLTWWQL